MNEKELKEIIVKHEKWLNGEGGERAFLREAGLRYADLRGVDLRYADLRYADLGRANLRRADLRYADLRGTNLDFSVFPLWCGTFNMKIDDRLASQLIAHLVRTDYSSCSDEIKEFIDDIPLEIKNKFCEYNDETEEVEE